MSTQHNDHDDGLVHSHRWATEPSRPQPHRGQVTRPDERDHDDGLVHSHGWACTERGRMAHRRG